ncbi:lytic transglycosylase domain-containing protein [Geobacter sp. DSM 9736]|uniref:lytic transglycosylase domain-containing protein n=1 Tax=Geobacter sp. DSM 9736 TaxID=1277350 RepID=UPI000B507478|nr:lytic transglycosylase domain-containing protein [Geobacter sp. DSM 9736]SNB46699.1 membrane-bound lytic murein transglycosylase D [Geobacter sp. DSM 9736]
MIKHKLLSIAGLFWAAAAFAEEPSLPQEPSPSLPAAVEEAGRTQIASAREALLIEGLDLAASDFFVVDESQDDGDFELLLPEDVLPESDIPLTLNSKVDYFVNYFQTKARNTFARWLSRSERYIPMMREVLRREGLPEDLVYLAMIESGFSPHAYSVASAVGPWQFMSGTGKRYSLRIDSWIDERRDPLKSTVAAALYLKELYDLFNKDWYLAAAGYNAGENKIMRAINMYDSRDFWQLTKGSYLKPETKDYVPKLLAAAIIAKEPAKYGFADVAYLPPIEFDTVAIPSRTDLELVARLIEIPYQTLRDLNPELRRWCTPPDYQDYQLKIPKGKKALFETEYAKVPEDKRFTEKIVYARYRMKKKDTLAAVARRYGTTAEALTELNHLKSTKKLRGKVLLVPVPATDEPSDKRQVVASRKAAPKEFNKYYTVKKGDTLSALAKKFNVSTKLLTSWNNLKQRVALRPGKRLIVAKYMEKKGTLAAVDG